MPNEEQVDRRKTDRRQNTKKHIIISTKVFIISLIIAIIVILAGVFCIVRFIQNNYNDKYLDENYYYDFDFDSEEDEELLDEDIDEFDDETLLDENTVENATNSNTLTTNVAE